MPCPLAAGGSLELGRQVAARAVGEEGEPRRGTAASGRHQLSGSLSHVAQRRQGHGPADRGFHFQIWMRTCPIPRIHARTRARPARFHSLPHSSRRAQNRNGISTQGEASSSTTNHLLIDISTLSSTSSIVVHQSNSLLHHLTKMVGRKK